MMSPVCTSDVSALVGTPFSSTFMQNGCPDSLTIATRHWLSCIGDRTSRPVKKILTFSFGGRVSISPLPDHSFCSPMRDTWPCRCALLGLSPKPLLLQLRFIGSYISSFHSHMS